MQGLSSLLKKPYLLFLGDIQDYEALKTATGLLMFCKEDCIGQYRLNSKTASIGLPDLSFQEAYKKGARTLVIGAAFPNGNLPEAWVRTLLEGVTAGFSIANGLHHRLGQDVRFTKIAKAHGVNLVDLRHPDEKYIKVGSGLKRPGKRLLTVGTDCNVGKMTTTLLLTQALQAQGIKATFRATGQTGILIAGCGVAVDAVPSDFISGAVEILSPANDPDHWDMVEGQGSLQHPGFASVSLGLLHGSQPDALILCHKPGRKQMRGTLSWPLPELKECMELNLACAKLTNPKAKFIGVSCNTTNLNETEAKQYLDKVEKELGLPCIDPVRTSINGLLPACD